MDELKKVPPAVGGRSQDTASVDEVDSKAQLFKAGEVMKSLERALKIRKLYSRGNDTYKSAIEHLVKRVEQYLQEFDVLSVRITSKDIRLGGYVIFENEDRDSSIAFQLYKDGIRRLDLSLGLTAAELERFIRVLELDREGRTAFDDDLVTLLWKGNFENIKYRVVDPVLDDDAEDDVLDQGTLVGGGSGTGGDAARSLKEEVKEFVHRVSSSLGTRSDLDHDSIGGGEDRGYQDEVPISTEERVPGDLPVIAPLEADEIKRLKREVTANKNASTLDKFVDILFTLFMKEGYELEPDDAGQVLWALITGYFNAGYFPALNALLERLKSVLDSVPPELEKELSRRLDAVSEAALLSRLPAVIRRGYKGGTGALRSFLLNLGPKSTKPLQDMLSELKGDSAHRQLILEALILGEGRESSDIAKGLLDPDRDIALATISVLRARKDRASIHYLPTAMKHSDPRVRIGAIDALAKLSDPRSTAAMLRGLEDEDSQVRLFTLRALKGRKDPRISTKVGQVVEAKDFPELPLWEQQHYFELLIENRGPRAFEMLKDRLTRKRLFGGKRWEGVRIAAAKALASLPLPATVALLKDVAGKEKGDLAAACEESLMALAGEAGPDRRAE